jgi:hypothetical protein
MTQFIRSTSGRLMSFSIATALIGGGASALMQSPASLYVMAFSTFMAIVGCVASIQLAVEEYEGHAIYGVILLPFLLFLYAVALGFVMNFFAAGAYAFLALGAAVLLVGLRSLFVDKAEAAPERQMMAKPAHAIEH